MRLDIAAGVIGKSILMALCWKRYLILTNGGMVEHAMKRISDYTGKSGIEINVGAPGLENCGG